ncbi:FecR family protein [Sphingobacterium chuzhouense]|uniref:DUF4974 domain-containing protein n=1 Tax=Sphingobacterium chuzhouense TaxID=1742264 RepID=A0ABR7XS67_9SPHI|nr:FecR family protein [Sphingobacterium chuzhouense]MBD1422023.1 DUF4974 domain-containing protein [Sphingobacterium chuzhouense]
MEKQQYYEYLASKWIDGTITEEEKDKFSAWFSNVPEKDIPVPPSYARDTEELRTQILNNIRQRLAAEGQMTPAKRPRTTTIWTRVAAAVLIIFSISLVVYQYTELADDSMVSVIEPGSPKAILTLSDNSQILLDTIAVGVKVYDGDIIIQKDENGHLRYSYSPVARDNHTTVYNTISTPRGGEYRLTLPDGSDVRLNAASSMKYPIRFTDNKREVTLLQGEAFFEINKKTAMGKRIPFLVHTGNQVVEVLGTKFNINAYDDGRIATTLVEGLINVGTHSNESKMRLYPGQQALFESSNNKLSVAPIQVDQVIAWKDGMFYFQDASLPTILAEFSRWYDIEIAYQAPVREYQFIGKIPRNTPLETALDVLKTTGVQFKIENRKLIVY